jgi:hypothetical protein
MIELPDEMKTNGHRADVRQNRVTGNVKLLVFEKD